MKTWRETVMSDEQIRIAARSINAEMVNKIMDDTAYDKVYPEDRAIAEDQAKISFKAGYDEGLAGGGVIGFKAGEDSWLKKTDVEKCRDNFTKDIILRTRKQAIREVVGWLKEKRETPLGLDAFGYYVWEHDLQAKLKEWGIKEVDNGTN